MDNDGGSVKDAHTISKTNRNVTKREIVGLAIVAIAMITLFIPPPTTYFVFGVFIAAPVMLMITYWLTRFSSLFKPTPKSIAVGLVSASLLYLIFYAGNLAVKNYGNLVGLQSSSETSIYSTIGAHPIYLQILILIFDAFGFESYFRGTLQNFISNKIKGTSRKKSGSVFLTALCDSLIHVVSLNPLWVVTTFIADSVWGLTYRGTKDLSSSVVSHFVWDVVIFVIAPIK